MDIKKREILVTSIQARTSKKTDKQYIVVTFIDVAEQVDNQYNVMCDDINVLQKVHGMEKWIVNIKITGSNFGTKLEVTDWIEKIGQV